MSLAVRMKKFKNDHPSPSEHFAGHIRIFREAIEEVYDKLKDGPAVAKAVFHDGSVREVRFSNFIEYYAYVAVLWKQVAGDHGVYLEYKPNNRNFLVGDIFHRLDGDHTPVIFVCNLRQTADSEERGFSRMVQAEGEESKYRETVVYCDGLYDTALQTVEFFQHGKQTSLYQIELDHRLLVCDSMEAVQRLAKSIAGQDELNRTLKAVMLSMERSEFVADADVMFNRRAFATACHELGHSIIQSPTFDSLNAEISETVAYGAELRHTDMRRTRLAEMLFDSYRQDISWRSRATIEYFELTMRMNRIPLPLGYVNLPSESIARIASGLLDSVTRSIYGKRWGDVSDPVYFEQVRRAIFDPVEI
jgi:hypothetical protein